MKRFLTLITLALFVICATQTEALAQAVSINATGNAPNENSILDVSSTTRGALLPRMNTTQRNTLETSLGAAEEGMTVYDNALNAYFYWDGVAWIRILSSTGVSLDAAYDAGTPNSGSGRVITADQGPVDIQGSSSYSLVTDAAVGVGTSTPSNLLHVYETTTAGGELVLGKFEYNSTNSNGTTGGIQIVGERGNAANEVAFIEFFNNNGSETLSRISTRGAGNGELMILMGDGASGLVERMVLDNAGNLQLDGLAGGGLRYVTTDNGGNVAATANLPLSSLAAGTSGSVLYSDGTSWVSLPSPAAGGPYALTTNGGGANPGWNSTSTLPGDNLGNHIATQNVELATFAIAASDGTVNIDDNLAINGKVVSDGINETSDARFKKNVKLIENALSTVISLEGVTYNWKTEEFPDRSFSDRMEYGVIAQQIEAIVPELVNTDSEGYKSVQYSHMVPLLIEAIKEQNALLSKQDVEIFKLKASVESLSDYIQTSKK